MVERRIEPAVPTPELPRPRVGVVLAAGRSRRLAGLTGGASKALMHIAGVRLVERAVRSLLDHGLEEVVVVVGYQASKVGPAAEAAAPGRVRTVLAPEWRLGNGASLSAAEPLVAGEPSLVLVTADHVFDPGALTPLVAAGRPAVLVDHAPDAATWAEGTRVVLEHDQAVGFSKEVDAPVVDCGAFLLTPAIFDAHREVATAGDHSLAAAVSTLARWSSLTAVALPRGTWWHDVDTPADVRAVRRKLRRTLVKPTDGPVSRLLNRPVSTRISMALAPSRLHPDVVSWLAFGLGIVAAWLLGKGDAVLGAITVHVASVLDGVDGELARLQRRESRSGALLDGVLDRLGDVAITVGLGIWAVDAGDVSPSVGVGLTAATTAVSILSMATKDRIAALGLPPAPERTIGYLLGGRDGRLLLTAIGGLAGRPAWALIAITATGVVALAARVGAVRRRASVG